MEVAEQLERFQAFLALNRDKINDLATKDVKSFLIDFQELAKYDLELAELLLENPEETIRAAEQSLDHFDLQRSIRIRFSNLPESQQFLVRNIRSEDIGKLLSIEGIIRQASDVRPQVTSARFECPSCGNIISILQLDSRFKEPSRCSCGRRGRFRLLSKDLVDAQHLKIEENPERLEGGEQPKRLSVFLKEDLVDPKMERRTTPGSKVRITGIIKEIPIFLAAGAQSTRYDLIMESNYIETIEETFFDIELNKKEEDEIKKLAKDPKVYEKLVKSIAPSIYGHERIKEAIILQLMSGVRKIKSDGTIIRGDMHILLVGDPGAGKSILLQFVASAAPKARLIAGRGATSAGLTASVIKDEFLRGYALEAGALVLANKGVCCLHPETKVISNYKIQKISELFDKKRKLLGKCNGELIEFNEIKRSSIGFDLPTLSSQKINSTVIRRKRYKGYLTELRFNSGFRIKLTPDHLLINGRNLKWEKAEEFRQGDKVLAPLKLPDNSRGVLIFDIIPQHWKIFLTKEEKAKLKGSIKKIFITLNKFNERFGVDKNFLSGGKQITKEKFIEVITYLGEENYWKNIPLKFGRVSMGERLKITKITPELAYFLGFAYGDGHVKINKRRTRIHITQSALHKDYIKRVKKCWNEISSRKLSEYRFKRSNIINNKKTTTNYFNIGIGSNLIGELYKYYTKNSLQNILSLSKSPLKGFIAGLMDSDGCISKRQCTKKGKKYYTQIVQFLFSNKLEDNLNFLLALRKLDCYGAVCENIRGNIKSIVISGRSDINCLIKELRTSSVKISKVELLKKRTNISCDSDKIPAEPTRDICTEISKLNKSLLLKRGIWSTVYDFKYMRREPSREQLLKVINKTEDNIHNKVIINNALNLVKRDYFLDRIVKIKKHKYDGYVYDLFVPGEHNFFANGIIVHNCIDELDKMSDEDRSAMHQALEQQIVTIAKANIQATLRAETTVLAAANPKLGRFDPYTPIASQIDLPSTLINRFDLIFPIRDIPNKELDEKIAKHVLKLQQKPGEIETELPVTLLRKFIAYARQKVFPVLSEEAINEIKDFYVTLRNTETQGDEGIKPIPISARQLEALVRLSEGSARTRLSKLVTKIDAKRAINILKYCLMQVGIDPETGKIDIDRISTGLSASERGKIISIKQIIAELEAKLGKMIPLEDIKAEALAKGIIEEKIYDTIDKLKRTGDIYEPKKNFISRV